MSTQSLPSFAQAFSSHLPPMPSRKRTQDVDDVHVKQEQDDDDPDAAAPPPSALMPSPKKRRVTVSGTALHIDVRPPQDLQPSSTPISPVVIGFNVQRDNPNAMEQVRSMINVKQKQKALIEQRRGSATGLNSPVPASVDPIPPTPRSTRRSPNNRPHRTSPSPQQPHLHPQPQPQQQQQQQQQPPAPPPPIPKQSLPPPPISFARRRAALLGGKKKPADIVISPRTAHTREQLAPAIQSAPPVPQAGAAQGQFYGAPRFAMSMALPRLPSLSGQETPRRVAGNVPPTPTRLAMLQQQQQQQQQQQPLPSLAHHTHHAAPHPPSSLGLGPNTSGGGAGASVVGVGVGGAASTTRSPPASVPIATSLVPPTPTSLHRPGYTGDKAAFLAPFEVFYDALNDSRQLKTWLGDQLRESRALIAALGAQQEKMGEVVEAAVERRMVGVRKEVAALRRKVEELEGAKGMGSAAGAGAGAEQRQVRVNGSLPLPSIAQQQQQMQLQQEGYTFPPAPASAERESTTNATAGPSSHHSNVNARRHAPVERVEMGRRMESPVNGWAAPTSAHGGPSDREREYMRERDREHVPSRTGDRDREHASGGGSLSRQPSLTGDGYAAERDREREREREREYMEREREREYMAEREQRDMRERERDRDGFRERECLRERERERESRGGRTSRRNSVVMAGPEEEEDDEDASGGGVVRSEGRT